MPIEIKKAARKQTKLRVGLSGPSGSGKTYSGLLIARGLASSWDRVCLIDTENGSGELYSDLGDYNTITLEAPFSPERYIEAIEAADKAGMEVIVIDSVTHEWDGKGGCLEINEKLAQAKFAGNTWAAWSQTTPRHQKFLQAILQSNAHVITTVRNKVETVQTDDKKIKKVGTKEIQREGFEYELTVNFNIDREQHLVTASKDRTKLFIDRDPFLVTEETGEELKKWNEGGVVDVNAQKKRVIYLLTKKLEIELPTDKADVAQFIHLAIPRLTGFEWDEKNLASVIEALELLEDKEWAQKTAWEAPGSTESDVVVEDEETVEEDSLEDVAASI